MAAQPATVRVAWVATAHAAALGAARRLREAGIAAACDLESSSDADVTPSLFVHNEGARWSAAGRTGDGAVDAAVTAIAEALR
jgi:hypothetical protein